MAQGCPALPSDWFTSDELIGPEMLTAHVYWCSLKVIYCFTVMSGPGERETEEAGVTTSQTDLGPGRRDADLLHHLYDLSSQGDFIILWLVVF